MRGKLKGLKIELVREIGIFMGRRGIAADLLYY